MWLSQIGNLVILGNRPRHRGHRNLSSKFVGWSWFSSRRLDRHGDVCGVVGMEPTNVFDTLRYRSKDVYMFMSCRSFFPSCSQKEITSETWVREPCVLCMSCYQQSGSFSKESCKSSRMTRRPEKSRSPHNLNSGQVMQLIVPIISWDNRSNTGILWC